MTTSERDKGQTVWPLGWWTRQLVGGVGWPTVLLAGLATFMTLQSFELPGGATAEILPAILLWLIVGAIWIFKPVVGFLVLVAIRYPTRTVGWGLHSAIRQALPPILLAVSIILVRMDYPLKRAVEISASDLRLEAAKATKSRWDRHASRTVGMFSVIGCAEDNRFGEPVICYTLDRGGGLWTHRGLYYSEKPLIPTGLPGGWYEPHPIYGPWYWWGDCAW